MNENIKLHEGRDSNVGNNNGMKLGKWENPEKIPRTSVISDHSYLEFGTNRNCLYANKQVAYIEYLEGKFVFPLPY